MAAHRKPKAKAEVSGATLKHPERYRDRTGPSNTKPLGDPFPRMTETERSYWAEFARELPWLHSGHRVLLRLTCRLAARMDDADGIGVSAAHSLSSLLSKLGATPVDESRVHHGDGDEESDPLGEFLH